MRNAASPALPDPGIWLALMFTRCWWDANAMIADNAASAEKFIAAPAVSDVHD